MTLFWKGENHLEVRLYSPVEWVKDRPARTGAFTVERLNTRRMQCTYGWDWVARFVTCGIGECALITYEADEAVTNDVYITTLDIDEESATVRADVRFSEKYSGRIFELVILDPAGEKVCSVKRYCEEEFIRTEFDIPTPELWYPLGYGEQPIYTFILLDGEKEICREIFGILKVKIMQLPDTVGSENYEKCLSIKNPNYDFNDSFSGFVLKVNGKRIFCRGANWVPCVPYGMGNVDEKQTELLELCAEAGVNMLRIWGGGAFESEHFYNECSRLGITVTQDFLMACGSYPEDEEWFIGELKKEALYAARLIRNKPCLMWWSGDNENAVEGCDTDENYMGRASAYKGIAPVLYREDPSRRFLPSSPYGGKMYASNTVGTTHNTQYLGSIFRYLLKDDLSDYKEEFKKYRARFIAEEPQLGAVTLSAARHFMTDEEIFSDSPMWSYHTKGNPESAISIFEYLVFTAEKILGAFKDGRDRFYKLRYIQYEWLRIVMEQARRETGLCSGIIFWMMNDCWPAASGWALIDYYNMPKDAFYSFKRCAKKVLSSVDCENGVYSLHILNDGECDEKVSARVSILTEDRKTLRNVSEVQCSVTANGANILPLGIDVLGDGEVIICDISEKFGFDRAFYKKGALDIRNTDVRMTVNEAEHTVTVTADEYVHAVIIDAEAVLDDNCFSLLPGESRTVAYRSKENKNIDFIATAYTLE